MILRKYKFSKWTVIRVSEKNSGWEHAEVIKNNILFFQTISKIDGIKHLTGPKMLTFNHVPRLRVTWENLNELSHKNETFTFRMKTFLKEKTTELLKLHKTLSHTEGNTKPFTCQALSLYFLYVVIALAASLQEIALPNRNDLLLKMRFLYPPSTCSREWQMHVRTATADCNGDRVTKISLAVK